MSRLGKTPILLLQGVSVGMNQNTLEVKGPKGSLNVPLPSGIDVEVLNGKVVVAYKENSSLPRPRYGLSRALIHNAIVGVSSGYKKQLKLIGVGYRAAVQGNTINLQLGFSQPRLLEIPPGIEIKVEDNTLVTVSGIDKRLVGQFSSDIRALRPPEPYKGKGVRYLNEYVRKKAGKSAKGK